MFVDSHCHINFSEFADELDALVDRMAQARVTHAMCISVTYPEWPSVVALAERFDNIYATAGVHPDYEDIEEPTVASLCERAAHPKVKAIGETGLDYYRLTGDLSWQRERFRTHIRAARECNKPLVIHTRNASEDTLKIMQEERAHEVGGVMHCFTESMDVAERSMEMGFHISFSGIVSFKSARELQAVAKCVPLERMLIETDAPYLAPVPMRGKRNEPSYVAHVAQSIAALRDDSVETIGQMTSQNFFKLFSVTP
ncbi:MAG: TatD family deoxyribonuclease [Betaproteobacteria bacterium]|nr:MAG: TatD family deoxyribonuclease [Betaproteobacteria bacterium]